VYVFVWISEKTAIISLYSINRPAFKKRFNPLQPSGYYMYHQFNIQQFYVLPTQCICFVWISEQIAIISLYSIN